MIRLIVYTLIYFELFSKCYKMYLEFILWRKIMSLELAIILVLGFILIYVLMIKIYSVLFRLTGLTRSKSYFQAISLISNTGFTTKEAEIIATSKVRRKIANAAMITGHVFSVVIVSLIFNLFATFNVQDFKDSYINIIIVFASFILLFLIFRFHFIKKPFVILIEKIAMKFLTKSNKENTITLLDNFDNESIAEVTINSLPNFMKEKSLQDLNLREQYKLNILSVRRNNKILSMTKNTIIQEGDVIIVFGQHESIDNLFRKNLEINKKDNIINQKQNIIELIDNYSKDALFKIKINNTPDILKDTTLIDSQIKEKYNINILTLIRDNISIKVGKDTIIKDDDIIIVFGPFENIKQIFKSI